MRRFLVLFLAVTLAAGPVLGAVTAGAAPPQPTGPSGTPSSTSTGTPTSTPTPDGSGNGSWGSGVAGDGNTSNSGGGLLGWLAEDRARSEGGSAVQQLAYVVVAGIAYVPVPNNRAEGYRAPTNGLWADGWERRQSEGMPLFWFFAVAFGCIYLIDGHAGGILKERIAANAWRDWGRSVLLGLMSATIAGVWLDARRGITMLLLSDITASGVEANLSAGVVLLALAFLLLTDAWALATLVLIVGAVIVIIPAAYPWLPVLFILGAAPSRIVRLVAGLLIKAWFVFSALTLPIAALIGFGFSVEIAPQLSETALALGEEQYATFLTEAVRSVLAFGAKFGSLVAGVVLAHKMVGLVDVVTPGINLTPRKEDVRAAKDSARERLGVARDRAQRAGGAVREAPGRVREGAGRAREAPGRARDRARSVRERLGERFGSSDGERAATDGSGGSGRGDLADDEGAESDTSSADRLRDERLRSAQPSGRTAARDRGLRSGGVDAPYPERDETDSADD